MGGDLVEAAQPLGVDFHVIASWPATQCAVRRPNGLLEQHLQVLVQLGRPFAAERALLTEDAVGVERLFDRCDVESMHGGIVLFPRAQYQYVAGGPTASRNRAAGHSSLVSFEVRVARPQFLHRLRPAAAYAIGDEVD